ncbi:hypothetical protein PRNP1_006459 [Phytophthora ramorum]
MNAADNLRVEAAAADAQGDGEQNCCIGCFRLLPSPQESPPEGCDDAHEPDLLCASCLLRCKSSNSPVTHSVGGCGMLSPLPKLSLLVKAEAKCQDQLQLLRCQQEILRQQRESLQATRQAKEEALVAERELARQRRKHFLMIQERRKREEELKFQQFQVEELTDRSEQEAGVDKPKKKRPKPPKVDTPLQRQTSERAADLDATELALPYVMTPMVKHAETPHAHASMNNDDVSSAEAHSTSLWERRRQMMICYSQDLSPLIEGRKPRRLPFPKPAAAITPSSIMTRRQTPDTNAQIMIVRRNKNQQSAHKQGKSPAPKTMKLRPLEEQKRYTIAKPQQQNSSNQFDDFHSRGNTETVSKRAIPSPLSLQPPRRMIEHSGPLTAEIKPVSWAVELTKDVLPQDDTHEFAADEAGSSGFSAPLCPVAEDVDNQQFTMFPLQYQLPKPTFPPSKLQPPAEAAAKAPRWEYSAERLSSLLEKYNVSVSTATPAMTAPKL